MKAILHQQPKIVQALSSRAMHYNRSLDFIKSPPKGVSIHVLAPPNDFPINRLTMDKKKLEAGYQMGLVQGYQQVKRNHRQPLAYDNLDKSSRMGVPIQ
jgi:predicted patatin/cPLA2 family phospholipase